MRKHVYLFAYAIATVVILGLWCGENVVAAPDWTKQVPTVISSVKNPDAISGWSRCSGTFQHVELDGYEDTVKACVYGGIDGIRLAQYYASGGFAYSISFAGHGIFYELRGICIGQSACMYGQEADAIVSRASSSPSHAVIHQNVSKKLKRKYDVFQAKVYFQYETETAPIEVRADSLVPHAETFAVSNGGAWGVVELKGYGILRLDLKSGEMRRVYAPGFSYGYGFDPIAELAITDDGSHIAIAGYNLGLDVYRVGNGCGDRLAINSTTYLRPGSMPCVRSSIDYNVLFPHFRSAYAPKFIDNDTKLSIAVNRGIDMYSAIVGFNDRNDDSTLDYLAIGDSFTSGEGENSDQFYKFGTNVGAHKCHLSSRAYPYLLGAAWRVSHKNVACSGARTTDVIGGKNYSGQGDRLKSIGDDSINLIRSQARSQDIPGVVAQSEFISSYQPSLVTIGIGGNDAGLMGKLSVCLMELTCSWAKNNDARAAAAEEIRAIYTPLREMYQKLKQASPSSKLVAIGYPSVINVGTTAKCGVVLSTVLNDNERRFISESLVLLNDVVKAAANAEDIKFIDIEDALAGSRLCEDTARPGMSAIRLGDDIAPLAILPKLKVFGAESFHPTPEGHRLIAQKILKAIPSLSVTHGCECNKDTATLGNITPSSYWGGVAPFRLAPINSTVTHVDLEQSQPLTFEIQNNTFEPGREVTLHVDAPNHKDRTLVTSDNGGLQFSVELGEEASDGFYEVRVEGDAYPSGERLAVYQIIRKTGGDNNTTKEATQTHATVVNPPLSNTERGETVHRNYIGRNKQSSLLAMPTLSSTTHGQGVLGHSSDKSKQHTPKKEEAAIPIVYSVTIGVVVVTAAGVAAYQLFRLRRKG